MVVNDPSRRSLTAAARVAELAKEMGVLVGKAHLVLSMVRGEPAPELMKTVDELGLNLAGILPDDEDLAAADLAGKPTSQLPADNKVVQAAFEIFEKVLPENWR